jgi:predicted nucleic acid-binding protein
MFFLLDVNIWVVLTSNRHVYHSLANEWLQSIETDEIAFCRISELGLLRTAAIK